MHKPSETPCYILLPALELTHKRLSGTVGFLVQHICCNGLLLTMRRQKPSRDNRDTSAVKPKTQPQSQILGIRRDITKPFSKAVAQPGQYENRSDKNWITVAFQASSSHSHLTSLPHKQWEERLAISECGYS
ncbi:hypothetical protein PENARI_c027G04855 [Penicillium arizonense]|uniref:Uncharacterized protein n=1 Tax=Penicillium arizonense TaxID=1835702 RepID=A0A1F5L5R0_PENAI|nr:hypothetical protein PENARI_c027G04855 [Penicillium arizonense]OGE48545.1 hypothetical protein PENARI_c027G04855 [Penicillium arizonense]